VFYEDYAGLAAILGETRFNRLCQQYLIQYPSKSGLLRFLGRKLEDFISNEPQLTEAANSDGAGYGALRMGADSGVRRRRANRR